MAVTYHILTGDVADALGVDFPLERVTGATLETNLPDDAALVADGKVRLPSIGKVDIQADGTFSIANLVASDSADINVEAGTLLYRLSIRHRYPQVPRPEVRNPVRAEVWSSKWFELNGSGTTPLSAVVERTYLTATMLSEYRTQLEGVRDDAVADVQAAGTSAALAATTQADRAETEADRAEQAAEDAVDISNIDTSDGVVSALVAGTAGAGPATRAAFTAKTVVIAPRPTFWVDFRNQPDHTIAEGELSGSGHPMYPRGQRPAIVQNGLLTMTHTQPAGTEAMYLLFGPLSEDITMLRAGMVVIDAGDPLASPLATATFAISKDPFDITQGFSDAAAHCSWNYSTLQSATPVPELASMRYDYFTDSASATPLARGQFPHFEQGVEYQLEVNLRDKTATVLLPNRQVVWTRRNNEIKARRGPNGMVEIYIPAGGLAHRRIGFTHVEAETESRTHHGRHATLSDIAGVQEYGKLLAFEDTKGAAGTGATITTPITTSLSAVLQSVRFPVSRSGRIGVTVGAMMQEAVPITPSTASQLLPGLYIDGNSTYGKQTMVYSGRTPANNTVDAAAFADRQGTMTAYTNTHLYVWAMTLDIDPAFQQGDLRTVALRMSAGANGHFNHILSGGAGGGGSTIQRGFMRVDAL